MLLLYFLVDSSDILGDDGRKAVVAIIKVSVLKKKPRTVHQAVSEFMKGRGREIPNDLDQTPNDKSPFNIPVAEDRSEDDYEEVDYGSGFIIRNKLIITAYHVVVDATENSAVEMEIRVSDARINGLKCQLVNVMNRMTYLRPIRLNDFIMAVEKSKSNIDFHR